MSLQLRQTVRQLSGGLAGWVPRITSPSRCIRVQATAGSGKTQLAHRLLDDAVTNGQAALYVCFNRSLADHMVRISSARAQVLTFHEACVAHHRRKHGEPDFTQAGIFAEIAATYIADSAEFNAKYDVLIVDEGQDFEPEWLQSLLTQLKDDGRLYLLEDDNQRLYERARFDLPEAVVVDCSENYRSPRAICDVINAFGLATPTVRSCNPYQGEIPGFHVYATPEQLVAQTVHAIGLLLAQGFRVEDIVVLTGHGLNRSALLARETIGSFSTRRFTGAYDRDGNPVWTAGELLVESVYRYKGQSAPAVVLAEMDFVELGEAERRKLFVGMTRAQVALEVVVSREAERCFAGVLGA
jgi:superfamily I DNA and RNA helicase